MSIEQLAASYQPQQTLHCYINLSEWIPSEAIDILDGAVDIMYGWQFLYGGFMSGRRKAGKRASHLDSRFN